MTEDSGTGDPRAVGGLLLCVLLATGCVPWVYTTGGVVQIPQRMVGAFEPDEDLVVIPMAYDGRSCTLRHPIFVKGRDLENRTFHIQPRRKLGTKDWMGHGGPDHFGPLPGLLYLTREGAVRWHLADDSNRHDTRLAETDRTELQALTRGQTVIVRPNSLFDRICLRGVRVRLDATKLELERLGRMLDEIPGKKGRLDAVEILRLRALSYSPSSSSVISSGRLGTMQRNSNGASSTR